jgi:hypothetical protein
MLHQSNDDGSSDGRQMVADAERELDTQWIIVQLINL